MADPKHPVRVIVAEGRGRVVGFAACGPVRGDEERGELLALYVDPREQRCGRGSALMEAAEDDLRDRGYGVAVVWVLSTNTPAIVFYRNRGWRHDSAERVEVLHGVAVRERRYRKRLAKQ